MAYLLDRRFVYPRCQQTAARLFLLRQSLQSLQLHITPVLLIWHRRVCSCWPEEGGWTYGKRQSSPCQGTFGGHLQWIALFGQPFLPRGPCNGTESGETCKSSSD